MIHEKEPRFIIINDINLSKKKVEELYIREVGGNWVIDNRFYFKFNLMAFEGFLHRAGYEEVDTDDLPERVVTKFIINDESKNAFAYYMESSWISIHGEIELLQNQIEKLKLML